MGTRNMTIVYYEGNIVVAQYCQWDGYPEGQGKIVIKFLKSTKTSIKKFKKMLKILMFVDDDVVSKRFSQATGIPISEFETGYTFEDSVKMKQMFPEFERSLGAGVLDLIYNGKVKELHNDIEDATEPNQIDIEWAYIIDLDKELLDVYYCRNSLKKNITKIYNNNGNQITFDIIKSYDLNDLPDYKTFCKELNSYRYNEKETCEMCGK
jgi:hypothetical protein